MTLYDRDLYGLMDGQIIWGEFFQNIAKGVAGWGVWSDTPGDNNYLRVTQRGAGVNMSVDVNPGSIDIAGTSYVQTGIVNIPIAAPTANVRCILCMFDASVGNAIGTGLSVASAELYPNPPPVGDTDRMPLGLVLVSYDQTSISNADITDVRVLKYNASP